MNQTQRARLFLIGIVLLNGTAHATSLDLLKPFPQAESGMSRFVIDLPEKDRQQENDYAVELIAGKTISTDGINITRLLNPLEEKTLHGWGYNYYELKGDPKVISTRMAPLPGTKNSDAFVTSTPLKIRYNSRLPIVVYVPTGYEVRYRIWQSSPQTLKAEQK